MCAWVSGQGVLPTCLPSELGSDQVLKRHAIQVVLEAPASGDVTDDQDAA